jgi:hypothetical protein
VVVVVEVVVVRTNETLESTSEFWVLLLLRI